MVDNFDKISDLLEFRTKDDFYFLQILQRKKDNKGLVGCNNNSRLIKAYRVKSKEQLELFRGEIIALCKMFNARAGINLNRRSFSKMALQHLKLVTDQILNKDFHKSHQAYNSVCGRFNQDTDKIWILDVDEVGRNANDMILFANSECQPDGPKFIATIPSKNGYHILMKPFNPIPFKEAFPDVDIHKNNPTNLYIP